ncbi:MAG: D-2-hydroxyacid dehydrogenase [Gammaproteobacteria bacterium]|nr:MAG: D-2-hydroxyacid dehydrogenase [Gammaproteobacteria bacterium]
MNKLLILTEDAEKYAPLVRAACSQRLEILAARDIKTATELVVDCNIILGAPPLVSDILSSADRIEWVQSSWAGIDRLCQPELRRDYVLTGVKDIFGGLISEYVLTYLFALERQIFAMRANQLQKRWLPRPYRLARDITLGIIGLGSIGQHVARTARSSGIRVTGLNRSGKPCDGVEKVYTEENLAEFLAEPDYLLLTLPDTPQTRHIIDADTLAMMKPSVVLINVGRGSLINEKNLVTALVQGQIGAAVLDVFETEPLPADSPLWGLPNVYITPHCAAASFPEDVVEIFVENYGRFIQGRPLLHLIDFARGY